MLGCWGVKGEIGPWGWTGNAGDEGRARAGRGRVVMGMMPYQMAVSKKSGVDGVGR